MKHNREPFSENAVAFFTARSHSMNLSSTSESVQSLNNDGVIIDASPGWLKASGYEKNEVIGHFFGEFLLDESRLATQREFPHLKDYGFVNNVRLKFKRKDGVVIEIVLNGTSKYNDDGTFERTFCEWRSLDYYINSTEKINQLLLREKFFKMIGYIRSNITALLLKNNFNNYYDDLYQILNEPSEVLHVIIEPDKSGLINLSEADAGRVKRLKKEGINSLKNNTVIIKSDRLGEGEFSLTFSVYDETMPNKERIIVIDFISSEDLLKDWEEEFIEICKLIESVSQMIRVNLEVKRLAGELQKVSETDTLTGISNRMILEKKLVLQKDAFDRYREKCSVIIVDIDYFKDINDTYGHNIGDSILRETSHILLENIRRTDVVGRWGGDEFLIVCKQTGSKEAMILAESLRKKIERHSYTGNIKLTSSFGVNEIWEGVTIEQMVGKADRALYEAKNSGRNRVCCSFKAGSL